MNRILHIPRHTRHRRYQPVNPGKTAQTSSQAQYSDPHRRLLAISRALSASQPVDELLCKVLEAIGDSFWFESCAFITVQPLHPALHSLLDFGGTNGLERFVVVDSSTLPDTTRAAIQTGKPRLIRPEKHNGTPLPPEKEIAQIIYPLQRGHEVTGALLLIRHGQAFNLSEFDLAQLFFAQASCAIEKTILAYESQTQTAAIRRLLPFSEALSKPFKVSEVSEAIGRGALALTGADRVAVYGNNPGEAVTHLWSEGISTTGIAQLLFHDHSRSQADHQVIEYTGDTRELTKGSFWRNFGDAEGIRALALCPVTYEQRHLANVDCFYNLPRDWSSGEMEALEVYVHQAAAALENTRLYEELEDSYLQTVLTLSRALNVRDIYTGEHSRRLADWAESTAHRLQCTTEEIKRIRWAAMLHDIGKIGIPDSILHKAGPLNQDEWQIMKRHPELGVSILAPVRYLKSVTPIIRSHQERIDGTGYPDGLVGDQIPLAARIITVVDAFGAMTDDRVYRRALSQSEAIAELKRCAGKQFDRQVVEVFFDVIGAEKVAIH